MANPSANQPDLLTIGEFAERVGRPTGSVAAQCFHHSRRRGTRPVAAYVRLKSPAVLWNATPIPGGAGSRDPGLLRTDAVRGVVSEVQPFDGHVEVRSADYWTLAQCQPVQLIDFTEAFAPGARRKRGFPVDLDSAVGGESTSDATWQVPSIVVSPDDVLVAVALAREVAEREKWTWPEPPRDVRSVHEGLAQKPSLRRQRSEQRLIGGLLLLLHEQRTRTGKGLKLDDTVAFAAQNVEQAVRAHRKRECPSDPAPHQLGLSGQTVRRALDSGLLATVDDDWKPDDN